MPASVARVLGAGVAERRTPPTVGCRTRETERGCVPGLPANGTRDGQDEEDAARPGSLRSGIDCWEATKTRRGCPRMWPQNRRGCKRAQLDQGQYGAPTLGKLLRREAASLRWKWQTSACRSCDLAVSATPQAKGDGQRAWGTPTVTWKGRNAGRTPAFVEASLLGDRWESLARSLWYIPGSGKGPPGF